MAEKDTEIRMFTLDAELVKMDLVTPYKVTSPKNFLIAERFASKEAALARFHSCEQGALLSYYSAKKDTYRILAYK